MSERRLTPRQEFALAKMNEYAQEESLGGQCDQRHGEAKGLLGSMKIFAETRWYVSLVDIAARIFVVANRNANATKVAKGSRSRISYGELASKESLSRHEHTP